jgi:hypothetical protein
MKRKIFNMYKITFATLYVLLSLSVNAQQNQPTTQNTAIAKLAITLSISNEKASRLQSILNYKHDDFIRVMRDQSIKPQEKHIILRRLMLERQHQIDSLIGPVEKNKLKLIKGGAIKKDSLKRIGLAKKQEEGLNRGPHRRLSQANFIDSIKSIKTH